MRRLTITTVRYVEDGELLQYLSELQRVYPARVIQEVRRTGRGTWADGEATTVVSVDQIHGQNE